MLKLLYSRAHFHATKVMLKIIQARLQQYVNQEVPDVQADLEKVEKPEIKLWTRYKNTKNTATTFEELGGKAGTVHAPG